MQSSLFPLRVKRWGDSLVVILSKAFRQQMNIHEGDMLAVRISGKYAVFCVWPPPDPVRIESVPAAALPPLTPRKVTNG